MAFDDFLCARLDTMVDQRHPLAEPARRMPWSEIVASLTPLFVRKAYASNGAMTSTCSARLSLSLLGA